MHSSKTPRALPDPAGCCCARVRPARGPGPAPARRHRPRPPQAHACKAHACPCVRPASPVKAFVSCESAGGAAPDAAPAPAGRRRRGVRPRRGAHPRLRRRHLLLAPGCRRAGRARGLPRRCARPARVRVRHQAPPAARQPSACVTGGETCRRSHKQLGQDWGFSAAGNLTCRAPTAMERMIPTHTHPKASKEAGAVGVLADPLDHPPLSLVGYYCWVSDRSPSFVFDWLLLQRV